MLTIPNVILTMALFLAMTVNLAMKPAHSARVTSFCMMSAVAYGLLVYGTGFIQVTGDPLFSMVRAVFCVMRMFVGVNELSAIAGSTFVSTPALVDIYWIFQLMALYSTASAIMIAIPNHRRNSGREANHERILCFVRVGGGSSTSLGSCSYARHHEAEGIRL